MGLHWSSILIILILALLLFGGRGKISSIMGDFAKGVRAFREGMKDNTSDEEEDENTRAAKAKPVEGARQDSADASSSTKDTTAKEHDRV